jgi:hypothetical protein
MHFLGLTDAQVRSHHPAQRLSRIDRGCPVDTARDRRFWHAGGTADEGDLAQARQPWSLARPQRNPGVVTVSRCAWWQDGTRWSLRLAGVGGRRGRLDAGEGTRADAGQEGPRRGASALNPHPS